MAEFREFRNLELSTVAAVRTAIDANFSGVTTVKSFKEATKAAMPVVCVRLLNVNPIPKEIGNTATRKQFTVILDIFATSDGQRLDLASFLTDTLDAGYVYNAYEKVSGNNNPVATPSGRVRVITYTQNAKVDFVDDVGDYDKFRHVISVLLERSGS